MTGSSPKPASRNAAPQITKPNEKSSLRVLILSQWYQPEPELKIHALARDLVARGHEVTAITGMPNYPQGRVYDGYRLRPWPQIEYRDGVRVVRVPLFPDHSRSRLGRVLNYGSFAVSASLFGPLWSGPADVMWVYHPPLTVGLPALTIAASRRIPCVLEIQDMWPETLAATGMVNSQFVLGAVGIAARMIYRFANRITVISPGFKADLIAKGVPEEKIEILPNWADEETYHPKNPNPELAQKVGMAGKFNLLYAGNMGPAQDLDNLLEAAALLRDCEGVQFVLIGDGVDCERLQMRVVTEGHRNVRFLGRRPPGDIAALSAHAAAMLVHLSPNQLFEITIPSKTISALACGRPVLTVSAGDPANLVTNSGAGLACRPGNPKALASAVRLFRAMKPEEREGMAKAARDLYLSKFTRAKIVPQYENLFRQMQKTSRKAGLAERRRCG